MAALTEPRDTAARDGTTVRLPLAAATTIFAGSLVARNAAGNAVPAADTAGLHVVGRAEETVVNAGDAGDKSIDIRRGVFRFDNGDAIDRGDIGAQAYAEDDQTVALADPGEGIAAGQIVDVDDEGVWIDTRLANA